MVRKLMSLAVAGLVLVSRAGAQAPTPKQVLSIQPLNAVYSVFSGEYERAGSKSVTWGVGGNYWGFDDLDYTSGEFKLRFYPAGIALQGFSFGGAVGFANVANKGGSGDESATGASIGVLLEYQWLMGEKKNFSFALGAGAKKLMIADDEISNNDFTVNYPTLRVSVGLAW